MPRSRVRPVFSVAIVSLVLAAGPLPAQSAPENKRCLTREQLNIEPIFSACPPLEVNIVDTVGAGDAYTAILALGILGHWSPETILSRASEFAGSVCAIEGAIPANGAFYDPYLPWLKRRDHESA